MRLKKIIVCGCLLFSISTSLTAAQVRGPIKHEKTMPAGPKIKVLLEKDTKSALLEAKGPFRVVRKDSGSVLSSGGVGKRFVVHALQDGLRWGEEYPDVYQISVIPVSKETSFLINGIQYKGAISIYHVRDNCITVVNEIPIEEYLKSTLAVQYEHPISKEAVAALTIAARTDAYNQIVENEKSTRPWDITAHEANYYGFGVTQRNNGIEDAVDLTRYMVLESIQKKGLMKEMHLVPEKVEELAQKGCNAKKILTTFFPHTKIGTTIHSAALNVR